MATNFQRRSFLTLGRTRNVNTAPRLPWLRAPETFTDQCTQCQACAEHCPQNIIVRGDGGFPGVNFSIGECTFCYECASHCPEGLFNERSESPWSLNLEISQACLAEQRIVCQSCRDACEPNAIRFPLTSGVPRPEVDTSTCTGCGACISDCPADAISLTTGEAVYE
ncbi:ferredoxin-type protein NapF [Alteromonas aestuariivivens]|uniref:Ferredoxin-type protein NapF n=1 Tax=Alteromonas aestuariivivens TaxID=1938339 RepID=A0A3D8M4N4_9ALTE|nr:ferredoxin-type protein NapF [Alteromonas aestuariivivens]RDV24505.1 ferredoxin-type protein NapF [Alteromonas aestuariivivens]